MAIMRAPYRWCTLTRLLAALALCAPAAVRAHPGATNHLMNVVIIRDMRTEGHLQPRAYYRTNRGGPRAGFIPAETLVLNGTAGDNGTASATLTQPVLAFLVG